MNEKLLVESEADVTTVLSQIMAYKCGMRPEEPLVDTLLRETARIKDNLGSMANRGIDQEFLLLGRMTMLLLDFEHVRFDSEKFAAFLVSKHKCYGAEPLYEAGLQGVITRIRTKLLRYQNLKNQAEIDPDDSLMDIIGYCVLGYQLAKKL